MSYLIFPLSIYSFLTLSVFHAFAGSDADEKIPDLMAVAFGYACHPTVLDGFKFSGDYPGFAQLDLEKSYPGVVAMFFQGAGGDQNPLPRRSVALAQQYGQELAAAVRRVLDENMQQLTSRISTAYSEVDLSLTTPPTKEELSKLVEDLSGSQKNWASSLLEQLDPAKYPNRSIRIK
jgi:hypothetical protein